MRNNTKINRNPKGELQKKVKKSIIEMMFKNPYDSYYNLGNSTNFCHFQNGTVNVYRGGLIRVI